MERHSTEDIISQQISAAIEALSLARAKLSREEIIPHLETAASFIHDIHYNAQLLGAD